MKANVKAFLAQLNQIRLDDDLSYADLASRIGIDAGALYKLLNGQSEPWDRTVHKIRKYLDGYAVVPSANRADAFDGRHE